MKTRRDDMSEGLDKGINPQLSMAFNPAWIIKVVHGKLEATGFRASERLVSGCRGQRCVLLSRSEPGRTNGRGARNWSRAARTILDSAHLPKGS